MAVRSGGDAGSGLAGIASRVHSMLGHTSGYPTVVDLRTATTDEHVAPIGFLDDPHVEVGEIVRVEWAPEESMAAITNQHGVRTIGEVLR